MESAGFLVRARLRTGEIAWRKPTVSGKRCRRVGVVAEHETCLGGIAGARRGQFGVAGDRSVTGSSVQVT